ncbi:DUF3948 domain-containing protein [Ectobacillus sp. JY-23]|nr:DUF3948 domain-containing protein [Ectobacillus sp. JY-23]UOY91019.1 DUF3948 domain-containing protein [Ectobacillus sp. JY-23]
MENKTVQMTKADVVGFGGAAATLSAIILMFASFLG